MDAWQELGISPTTDRRDVKRAYARKLKTTHPEDDPEGFQALRIAFEEIMSELEDTTQYIPTDKNIRDAIVEPSQPARHPQSLQTPNEDVSDDERLPPRHHRDPTLNDDTVDQRLPPRQRMAPVVVLGNPDDDIGIVEKYIREVIEVLSNQGEQDAIKHLQTVVQSTEMNNLDLRHDFEESLLNSLVNLSPMPMNLVIEASSIYGWEERGKKIDNKQDELIYLVARLDARAQREELEIEGKRWWKDKSSLARALTGKLRITWFRWLALRRSNLNDMREKMELLQSLSPELLEYELDHDVLKWWLDATSKPRFLFRHIGYGFILGPVLALFLSITIAESGLVKVNQDMLFLYLMIAMIPAAAGMIFGFGVARRKYQEKWKPILARHYEKFISLIRNNKRNRFLWEFVFSTFILAAILSPVPYNIMLMPIAMVQVALVYSFVRLIVIFVLTGLLVGPATTVLKSTSAVYTDEISVYMFCFIITYYCWWLFQIAIKQLSQHQFFNFFATSGTVQLVSGLLLAMLYLTAEYWPL